MFNEIDLKEALRRSIQTEKNAMDFYERGAAAMKNAGARKVFDLAVDHTSSGCPSGSRPTTLRFSSG